MIRTLTAGAALALSLIGPASALTPIGVDDFEMHDQSAMHVGSGNVLFGLVSGVDGPSAAVTPSGLSRTISHTLTVGDLDAQDGSFVLAGPIEGGRYSITNGDIYGSVGTVAWTLAPGFIPHSSVGAATLKFDVVDLDLNAAASLYHGASLLGTTPLSIGVASLALTSLHQNSLSGAGGVLKLSFSGDTAYDLTIDNVRFEISPVPEASTAAMTLAGLLALYSLRRRSLRRQSDV